VTLLSRAPISFTVEADDDDGEDAAHTMTSVRTGPGPWLTLRLTAAGQRGGECWTPVPERVER
jgi:hypothetical protein